jgi:hypothetical protein
MQSADPFDTTPETVETVSDYPVMPANALPAGLNARQIRTTYVTAMSVPKPRDALVVEKAVLDEAARLGAEAFYAWEVQGKSGPELISGASVKLALAVARCFGNCAVEPLEVQETEAAYYFKYAFIDLETGFTLTRPFRQSRSWVIYGRMEEDRKEDIRFQLGASKAMRNVICNALGWYVDRGLERARQGERAKIEKYIERHGLEAAQAVLVEALAQVGASVERVLAKVRRPTPAALTVDDMVLLRGDLKMLQQGQEELDALFPLRPVDKPADDPAGAGEPSAQEAATEVKAALRQRAKARQAAQEPQSETPPVEDQPEEEG